MTNLKAGQILKGKKGVDGLPVEILLTHETGAFIKKVSDRYPEIFPQVYFYTFYEIEKYWEVPKEKWKPKEREVYFYIKLDITVGHFVFYNDSTDNELIESGNCFKTREEAEKKAQEIKNLLAQ